ncbi:tRNA dimethylallyltransferase 2 [Vitis vinifera]|uniref:tRNA dimethylallyltransferase 2 n=1 Tax=Vitis vinifera TaxID=29760 RepID=A0A438KG46_VITVI|nr:tRNA dimethylallyltransferase 2 [Vitis vinifera]
MILIFSSEGDQSVPWFVCTHWCSPQQTIPGKGYGGQNWGRVDNFKYRCCFICVDAALPILDGYVGQRVDSMIDAGLLDEVYDIYSLNADYTRGLRQAIGVREFEDFLKVLLSEGGHDKENGLLKGNVREILKSSNNDQHNILLQEAIERVKANTRRLVRRQKYDVHGVGGMVGIWVRWSCWWCCGMSRVMPPQICNLDLGLTCRIRLVEVIATKKYDVHGVGGMVGIWVRWSCWWCCGMSRVMPPQICNLDLGNPSASWAADVVEPSVKIIRSFLRDDASSIPDLEGRNGAEGLKSINRDLWTQYICKACGDRVLRGLHEWEQHKQGRGHRKRISRSRNLQSSCLTEQQQQQLLRHEASKPRK